MSQPASQPAPRPSGAPPSHLPEQRAPVPQPAPRPANADFQRAQDEYFRLRGLLVVGRITTAQFEAQLRELMVQDARGRYWILGADSGKWFVHDGNNWVEGQPE
jgi:hypothetical protein